MQNEKILLDLGKKVRVTIAFYLSLVLTPTAGYFIYFGGRIKSENLVFFLVTVVVSSLAVQIFFAPLRVKQFQKLQALLDKINEGSSASEQNAKELKTRLISHPIEGSLYAVLGTVPALIVFSIVFSLSVEITPFFWFSAAGTFLFTSSYIFILVVMLTERLVGKYISIPQLANQKIEMKDVSFIGERGRKIWMIVSITSFPVISLGIIAAQAGMNLLSMSAIFIHFIVIFVFVLFYAGILIYESERNSIGTMVKVIEDLEAGNIAHENIPMTSSSEIGFLMQDIDSFHN